jgi:Xaa-Pro aminopeptidase
MYREQRAPFLERLARERAAAIVFSGSPRIRNHDCDYRFRPDSDFFYLSGFEEPEAVLVLLPHRDEGASVLFLRARNREEEIWTGRRLGVDAAPEALGVDAAYPIEELGERLPELLKGTRRLVYRSGLDEGRDRRMIAAVGKLRGQVRGGVVSPLEWIDPALWLHEQRLFKSESELEHMRRAAAISAEAHAAAMSTARPGANEAEIDALLEYTFRRHGSTGSAYTPIVAGGANACILHYVQNDQPLRAGELLLIDAGAEWRYYASDVTRTFPIDGTFRPEQRALYELVLGAQLAAIERVRPGATFVSVHDAAVAHLTAGLIELGLLEGPLEKAIEDATYRRFYMHRTGHWLGLDVHDCGAYFVEGESRRLEPGMVTTVEPGLYIAPDDEGVEERWRGIGIRIEDDVLVAEDGHEVLTDAIPKTVEDVEAACAGAELVPARS